MNTLLLFLLLLVPLLLLLLVLLQGLETLVVLEALLLEGEVAKREGNGLKS